MRSRHADRLWMIAGAAVALLLGVVTWLLLVAPQHADAAELNEQIDAATAQAAKLRKRNAELAAVHAKINKLTKMRNDRAAALPPGSGIPAFLRQMQASGTDVDVDVSGISVGQPTELKGVPGVWAVPIQLTAEGTVAELGSFLDQLQSSGQKRAVLIENASLDGGGDDEESNLNLMVKAFVAPPAGAGAPTVTTD
jgi:type IV pilus assembly protein PilO